MSQIAHPILLILMFQVKQKKKSSNKWNCAVCNQKQSVRKVFAQGFMAKDLRKFVQSFNMSRKIVDDGEWLHAGTLGSPSEHRDGEIELRINQEKKRRADWSEYLDREDHHNLNIKEVEQEQGGDGFEPVIVTELEKVMFKKRKSDENSEKSAKLFKEPVLRNSQEKPMKDKQPTPLMESHSKRSISVTLSNQRTQNCKPTISKTSSKWSDYISNEDNGNSEHGWERAINFKDKVGTCSNSFLEDITNEERVEDDIHPDFM
ncbi:hypothetical protein PIB30_046801 [Stylosanthes scabra]|uniref:MRN complex-interacting protein N-terminal domain-containing protein n=1 Tax=Stylosanthes scabra TaxID=79078 RepID=A0ABU6RH55_9FABA|nr:hypothetical protein [Stylosanthes scabra]